MSRYILNTRKFFLDESSFKTLFLVFLAILLVGIIARKVFPTILEMSLVSLFMVWFFYLTQKGVIDLAVSKNIKKWLMLLFVFMLINLFPESIHYFKGEGSYEGRLVSFVERYLHLIMIGIVTFLGYKIRLSAVDVWKVLIIVSCFVLWVILYEMIKLEFNPSAMMNHRFGLLASSNTIDFGIYSNTLFIVLLGALFWFKDFSKLWKFLLVMALIVDISGAILSQSRTAWIGWPEAIIGWGGFYLYRLFSAKKIKKVILFLGLILVFLIVIIMSPAKEIVENRVNKAISNVIDYKNGNPNSSLGNRFVMYEVGINQIQKTPWLGVGVNNFTLFIQEDTKKLINHKFGLTSLGYTYSHIHNQFLMSFILGGIFPFLSLLVIFGFLLWFFSQKIKTGVTERQKALGIAGLVFTITSLMTFLPESPLMFKSQFIFFFVMASLLFLINDEEILSQVKVNNDKK